MAAIGGRKVKVEITPVEAGTGSEYSGYLTNARFASADSDSDTITFADANSGSSKDWTFQGTALQDDGGDTASFFAFVDANVGEKVTVTIMPQGNETPSTTQPHRTQVATVQEFDGDFFGGDASTSVSQKNTFDFSWPLDGRPTSVTAAD